MKTPQIPEEARIIRTYAEYAASVEAFFAGHYTLLVVIGRPGLSKSFAFQERLTPTSHLLHGWTTPLQAYMDCYHNRNKTLVLDDAESLWQKPAGRTLMRSLAEHKTQKVLQWASTARDLVRAGVPQRFTTSSRVAIIANELVFGGQAEREAVLDRAHVVYFDPLPQEIHRQVARWFWDQDIYDYVGARLQQMRKLSARVYIKSWEHAQAGGAWQDLIDECYCHDSVSRMVQALESDPTCPTVDDKVRKFIEKTGACRATYFNLKRVLKANGQLDPLPRGEVPPTKVAGQAPTPMDIQKEVDRARDEDRINPRQAQAEGSTLTEDPAPGTRGAPGPQKDRRAPDRPVPPDVNVEAWCQRELAAALGREDFIRAAKLRDFLQHYRGRGGGEAP